LAKGGKALYALLFLLALAGVIGWGVYQKLGSGQAEVHQQRQRVAAPVEVATVEVGAIEQLRSFTSPRPRSTAASSSCRSILPIA
jgi:predicted negative regulator of RcsB-dependent stress response